MVYDHISQSAGYSCLGARFALGFDYIKAFRPEIADGRYELDGDNVFALVQSFETAPAAERSFESHESYADIHFIQAGGETIYYAQSSLLTPKGPFDATKDVVFYQDHDDYPVLLGEGYFTVFWPHDAHKPACIRNGGPESVRKVVIKVRL